MKKAILLTIGLVFLLSGTTLADKPQDVIDKSNGFPSGEHYNLNIHGKKAEFNCPEQEYYLEITDCPVGGCTDYQIGDLVETCPDGYECGETNTPIYGNSIFVPEDGQGIEIYMQSGKVGGNPKKAAPFPTDALWAIDPCAGFDGDGAVIQLPPGEYDVYARALAKPTDDPDILITPELIGVEDEDGNDLVYLGLVTETGWATPTASFTRTKGKSKAIDITGLFEWSGTVCYLIYPGDPGYTVEERCCHDYDLDGIYDYCCEVETIDDVYYIVDGSCAGDTENALFNDGEDCLDNIIDVYCQSYTDEWVFNIGDFVNYLWNADNNGVKLLQVRFYPRK